jgi:O-antigen/teichoic acid export membrane protein
MAWSNSGVAFAAVVGALVGVVLVVAVVFRRKRPRADLRSPSVAPANDADRAR